jgi:hypothetical protein
MHSLSSDLIIDESDQEECTHCTHCDDLAKKVERHSVLLLQMKEILAGRSSTKRKRVPHAINETPAMNTESHVFIREEVAKRI